MGGLRNKGMSERCSWGKIEKPLTSANNRFLGLKKYKNGRTSSLHTTFQSQKVEM